MVSIYSVAIKDIWVPGNFIDDQKEVVRMNRKAKRDAREKSIEDIEDSLVAADPGGTWWEYIS